MKKLMLIVSLATSVFLVAQNVVLTAIAKVSDNKDKYFYRINPENPSAQYLAELEVRGFSSDDVETFAKVYKKAKEIGANAFALYPFTNVDESPQAFDPVHYRFRLYFVPAHDIPNDDNIIYIINPSIKSRKVSYNGKSILFPPRTFLKDHLMKGREYSLSTGKLFGSSVRLVAKDPQPVQFLQISGAQVRTNSNGTPGVNLKSGDIIRVERSFGDFLTTIYGELK